jgi:hypothetical protein
MVNGRQICVTILFGRRAYAYEDRIGLPNGFASIGGIRNSARIPCGVQNLIQVMLENRDFTRLQSEDPIRVNIGANHFVARIGETRTSY